MPIIVKTVYTRQELQTFARFNVVRMPAQVATYVIL